MKPKDGYLRVMVTLLVIGVWVLILKPLLAPAPSEAAQGDQPVAKVVRAQRFEVVDAAGRLRARLEYEAGRGTELAMLDSAGMHRLQLWLMEAPRGEDGKLRPELAVPMLVLADEEEEGRVSLALCLGTGTLRLHPDRPLYSRLGSLKFGSPEFKQAGKQASAGLSLRTDSDGRTRVALADTTGQERAVLGIEGTETPRLVLMDKDGNQRAALGATGLETTRTGTVVKRPESSLVLFDKEEKVIWQAPP